MRKNNIYYKLIRDEDTYSECLANLMQFDEFRNSLVQFLSTKLKLSIELLNFGYKEIETQVFYNLKGKPDIQIRSKNLLILLESKVSLGTTLTNYQPNGYLSILNSAKESTKCLIFIVPKHYAYQYDIREAFDAYENTKSINFEVIHWEELILFIERKINIEKNIAVKHFIEFSKIWFPMQNVSISTDEFNHMHGSTIGSTLYKLMEIIDFVYNHPRQVKKIKTYRKANDEEYGLYFENTETEKNILYLGIWYEYWKQTEFPICIAVREEYDSFDLFKDLYAVNFKHNGWHATKFELFDKINGDKVNSDNISNRVNQIITELIT